MSCGRATRLPGFEDFAHADMLTSSDCLDPKADDEDNGCFNTLIDRNVGIFYLRGGSPQALALMRAWHARVVALAASTNRAIENEQTVFDDLWRGRGTGHRRNMTREGRAIWYRQKLEWCGMPADTKEGRSFGKPSALDGLATNGSRRVYDVCVPFVARRLRLGGLPLSLIANGHTCAAAAPHHRHLAARRTRHVHLRRATRLHLLQARAPTPVGAVARRWRPDGSLASRERGRR
mmetsp:Transcript_21364/g.70624  ORF Transcript_21364/g.70624 Transcript_21364/m.70624 type:complete len:235 (+) Transcript_21364:289-993(+)